MKNNKLLSVLLVLIILVAACLLFLLFYKNKLNNNKNNVINLTNLTNQNNTIKTSELKDYNDFLNDFNNNNLPDVYVTKFVFDGAGIYKPYDLDEFVETDNEHITEDLTVTALNINKAGNYELSGDLLSGMILVNSNNLDGDINITLNNVNINTDSKKVPAIYVYNKDITYSAHKVTIKTKEGSKNYIEGGKFKKVSLLDKNNLSQYENYYKDNALNSYNMYPNYFGIYSKEDINKVLFASVTADNEDLQDADPYLYYKASGAISSDIDLYFEGTGYLEVTSKNKEGIESKGNLTFSGGTGDYVIKAEDDCLNTTTDAKENSNAHNSLTIDVKSLTAIVNSTADEGDGIDSNGTLTINNGRIIAIAKPGQESGIDTEKGIYINGGSVLSTGDMLDQIDTSSKQNFMVLSFGQSVSADDLITVLDQNNKVLFSYKTDRAYKNLVYSSSNLKNGIYHAYIGGNIDGNDNYGYYESGTYSYGTQLGYTSLGASQITPPSQDGNSLTPPNLNPQGQNITPPEHNNDGTMSRPDNSFMPNQDININPINKDFTVSSVSNIFSGVGNLIEQ